MHPPIEPRQSHIKPKAAPVGVTPVARRVEQPHVNQRVPAARTGDVPAALAFAAIMAAAATAGRADPGFGRSNGSGICPMIAKRQVILGQVPLALYWPCAPPNR